MNQSDIITQVVHILLMGRVVLLVAVFGKAYNERC